MSTTMLYIQTSVSECQSPNTYMLKLGYYKGFPRYTTACHVQWASSHPVIASYDTELKWESFNLCWVRFYTFDAIGEVYKEVYVLVLILGTSHRAWSHGLQRVLNWVQTSERRACWSQMQNRGSGKNTPGLPFVSTVTALGQIDSATSSTVERNPEHQAIFPYEKITKCPYPCTKAILALPKIYLRHTPTLHGKQTDWACSDFVC